ncbi:MAG: DegT/DnrJ/EryC1/StrS family aminotransferase [Candidatus Omnitrophica bacterium]|nr:DegT/DnrJ/EryC1/StrS family aminotransferase [Candidatus Omnitrophota bacterium]
MKKITIADLKINNEAKQLVRKVLNSNRLTYGPITEKFESEFARIHNRKYALFMNSSTSALQVGLHALKTYYKWQNYDEVLVPGITFVASSNVIIQNNLKPVFVDVDPDYYEIDANQIEKNVTKKLEQLWPSIFLDNHVIWKKF